MPPPLHNRSPTQQKAGKEVVVLLNLIEKFLEDTEKMRVFLMGDKGANDYQEVYFFLGRDGALCISKQDNKVLSHIKYSQLQITITSPSEFVLNINGGTNLFFYQDETDFERIALYRKEMEPVTITKETSTTVPSDPIKYPYKAICDSCTSKKCSQYDTINGRNFKFGKGPVSEDLLAQYDKYCETKIKKFGCNKQQ